jgi:hypothetical protein
VLRIDEAATVWRFLDEHHRWMIVEILIQRNFDEVGLLAANQRMHPFTGRLR